MFIDNCLGVYTCTHRYIRMRMQNMNVSLCVEICMFIHVNIHMYQNIYINMYTCIYVHLSFLIPIYPYTYMPTCL